MPSLAVFLSQHQPKTVKLRKPAFLSHFSVSLCVLPLKKRKKKKKRGQAQTAWEWLTTRGSEQRYIKGHPICTAAYTHPHIHKHRLTYLGLLSLKFITSGRTITLFDSMCVSQLQEGRVQLIHSSTWPKSSKLWNRSCIIIRFFPSFPVCESESTACV